MAEDAPGMRSYRSRNQDGQLRDKYARQRGCEIEYSGSEMEVFLDTIVNVLRAGTATQKLL